MGAIRSRASLLALLGLFATVVSLLTIVIQVVDRDRQYRALLADGDQALAADNAFASAVAYSGALALRPESVAAHIRRGQAYRAQRREDDAIRDWTEASHLAPRSTQPLELLGDLYSQRGEDAQAATYFERCVQLDAQDPTRLYKLGLARYRAGSPSAAIDPLRRAVALNDNFAEAHYLLGLVLRDTQATPQAADALERAVRIAPSLTAAREELADLYRATGRPVQELTQLQALATLDPRTPRSIAIALAEARGGQFDGAITTLTAAAEKDPNDSQVQLALGRVYLAKAERSVDRRSVTLALSALERALGGTARRSEGLTLLGRALYLSGDYEGASRILNEAVSTSPLIAEAFAYLADAYERINLPADAREALNRLDALEGDTALPAVRVARARRSGALALKAGDAANARLDLQRAVDGGERDAVTLGQLADAQWRDGAHDAARTTLAAALDKAPRSAELLRLKRVIR
ncbi:MAG: tetratricopeptide repeat protein [Acidobacteria bacterium]|nr:tetratricopeptide repeat protein [Acidobacteriota bacterium]